MPCERGWEENSARPIRDGLALRSSEA
jgi:hypothetical protein